MKRAASLIVAAGFAAVALAGCKSKVQETPPPPPVTSGTQGATGGMPPGHPPTGGDTGAAPAAGGRYFSGTVVETMDAGGYTYVQVDNGKEKIWAAAPQFETKKGEKVTVPEGMPMENYESKTLNRKFDVVYFVGAVGKGDQPPAGMAAAGGPGMGGGAGMAGMTEAMPEGAHPKMDPSQAAKDANVSFSGLKKADKTVAEVYSGQSALSGKDVTIRGKVVKFSPQIMGKNWLHVQDGTGASGTNDLTVTTADSASVGDTVLVTGKLSLKKDFGMGYKYDVIIEDGRIKVE